MKGKLSMSYIIKGVLFLFLIGMASEVSGQRYAEVTYDQITSRVTAKDIHAKEDFEKITLPNGDVLQEGTSVQILDPHIMTVNTFTKDTIYKYARIIKGVPVKAIGGWNESWGAEAGIEAKGLKGIVKNFQIRKNRRDDVFEVYVNVKLTENIDGYTRHSAELKAFVEGEIRVIDEEVNFDN